MAKLHDTSSREIEAHYAAHILDVTGDVLSRKGLLRPDTPTADNVVTLSSGRRSWGSGPPTPCKYCCGGVGGLTTPP